MMESTPQFLQGIFGFEGAGLHAPAPLDAKLAYTVPADKRTQLIYMRAGNSCGEMITLMLLKDGKPIRYFPLGAKSGSHVSLAVVEDLPPDTRVDVHFAAPAGVSGSVVLDIGMLEI